MFESWYIFLLIIVGGLVFGALTDIGRGVFSAIVALFYVVRKAFGVVRGHGGAPPVSLMAENWGMGRLEKPYSLKVACLAPLSEGKPSEHFDVDLAPDQLCTKVECPICEKTLAITRVTTKAVLVHRENLYTEEVEKTVMGRLKNAKWGVLGGLAAVLVLPVALWLAHIYTVDDTLMNRLAVFAMCFMFLAAPFGLGGLMLLATFVERLGKLENGKLKEGELILVDETLAPGIADMAGARPVLFKQGLGELASGAQHVISSGGITGLSDEKALAAQGVPKGALALVDSGKHNELAQEFPQLSPAEEPEST